MGIIEMIKKTDTSLLLTLEEFKELRAKYNFRYKSINKREFDLRFKEWNDSNLIKNNQLKTSDYSVFFDLTNINERRKKVFYEDYIFLNMVFGRIPINKGFIENFTFAIDKKVQGRLEVLYHLYEQVKPRELPDISEIKNIRNVYFILSIVLLSKDIKKISEQELVEELFRHYSNYTNKKYRNLYNSISEFSVLFYPYFVAEKIMGEKENIVEFLHDKSKKKNLSEEEDMWEKFNEKFSIYKNTEFYGVLRCYIEECVNKNMYDFVRLKVCIRHWEILTEICARDNINKIKKITTTHRDILIKEQIENSMVTSIFINIRSVLKFYNDVMQSKDSDNQELIYIFSNHFIPKKPKDISHVGLMETGIRALISSVGSEIIRSRNKEFRELNLHERNNFFLIRIIWLAMLTGSRISEIKKLSLDEVKKTISFKIPYLKIKTLKNNDDIEIKLVRGKELVDSNYEYDLVHLYIINETIKAAEEVYKNININDRFLFPSNKLKYFTNGTIIRKLYLIQQKNGIVCGSHYDILSRDLYESFPKLSEKLVKKAPLFTNHDLRHANLNWLLVHGGLTRYEIQETAGHTNVKSQEEYLKSNSLMLKVSKLMEVNGHYGAENELVSPELTVIDKDVDRSKMLMLRDIESYLTEFEGKSKKMNVIEAQEFIDINTDCHVIVSCSALGMACLACNDFRTGSFSEQKMDNISFIIKNHIQTIDLQIEKINKNKKSLMSDKGEVLLIETIKSLIDRFIIIDKAIKVSLISQEQGFGIKEEAAVKIVNHFMRKNRNLDLDSVIVDKIKNLRSINKFENVELFYYRTKNNRKVFQ